MPKEKVLAALVQLLETSLIRVGNDEYVKNNRSFGLTTMHDRHASVNGTTIRFRFRGKGGVTHDVDLKSPLLAKIVKRCQDLPGQELFQYVDQNGQICDVGSKDVNDYLRNISGVNVTAKDYRTWAGTALAAEALREFETFDTEAGGKKNILRAIERVASRLGNTPSVCRKCYIHPAVIDAYMDQSLAQFLQQQSEAELRKNLRTLSGEEAAVLALLQQRLKRKAKALSGTPGRSGRS
jgi:DNA topoisomerase-1